MRGKEIWAGRIVVREGAGEAGATGVLHCSDRRDVALGEATPSATPTARHSRRSRRSVSMISSNL